MKSLMLMRWHSNGQQVFLCTPSAQRVNDYSRTLCHSWSVSFCIDWHSLSLTSTCRVICLHFSCDTCSHWWNSLGPVLPYTLRPRQNGCHFADDSFKRTFLNENFRIPIKNSLNFVPKGPINNIPALAQIMAWRRSGDKPLSEPMVVELPTHICITRPQLLISQNGRHFADSIFRAIL